jgi:NAD(P)-dependent dehydrogenase (short-subunit alcohol dehydrogenase family)
MAKIVVTGANRGLGLEFVRQLLARGDEVIAAVRHANRASELTALAQGRACRIVSLDAADDASAAGLARELAGEAVDGLINNAGVGSFDGLAASRTEVMLNEYNVNAIGPLRVARALLPNLRLGAAKKIMSVTSLMGSIADNTSGGAYGYRMSKAALNMGNKCLALDLAGDGITAVVVNPGWVKTDMGGAGAPLTADVSIRGMLAVYDKLTLADTGKFLHHEGRELPW